MKNFSFMAFGKAQESKEAPEIKRYTGVGSVFVMGVNPNIVRVFVKLSFIKLLKL